MLLNGFGTEYHFPRQSVRINDVESRVEDLAKPFAFPTKSDCSNRQQLFSVETDTENFVLPGDMLMHLKSIDDVRGNKIVNLTSSIKSHLEFQVVVQTFAEYLHSLEKIVTNLLESSESLVCFLETQ